MSGIGRIGALSKIDREESSQGLEMLEKRDKLENAPPRNERLHEAAKMYEKYFLGEMMKAMRSTVSPSDATKPSMAENIYRGELDQQYVQVWGDQGGIGLSELIYDQMMERYFGGGPGRELKSQGPIALSDRDLSKVHRIQPSPGSPIPGQTAMRVEVKPHQSGEPARILAPWNAKVLSNTRLDGETAMVLEHGSGLRSTVIFQGVVSAGTEPGRAIEKGQPLGVLSPDAGSFVWNLNQPSQDTSLDDGPEP